VAEWGLAMLYPMLPASSETVDERFPNRLRRRPSSLFMFGCKSISKKIPSFLRPVKDDLELKTLGVYSAPFGCGQVCIGQTGLSIETGIKENQLHIRLEQPDRSAVAEHIISLGHRIKPQDTILSTRVTYVDRMVRETIEIELYFSRVSRSVSSRRLSGGLPRQTGALASELEDRYQRLEEHGCALT
jgi:hypothetical protein